MMSWILYIILGTTMPTLHQVNRYANENGCRAAITELPVRGSGRCVYLNRIQNEKEN